MSAPPNASGNFHAVRFYKNDEELCRIVAEFLGEGLVTRQPAIVIATPEHRAQIVEQLTVRAFDIGRLEADGQLLLIDADEALGAFMLQGMPNASMFRRTIVPYLEKAAQGTPGTIRAYGEMVDVLWKRGLTVAATRLEMLWNDLARTHDFSLLCGYSMGSFYKDANVREICAQHTHVVADTGAAAPVN